MLLSRLFALGVVITLGLSVIGALSVSSGTTQETWGRVPARAESRKREVSWMLPSWPSCFTVVNEGSGFQISGVEVLS